MDDGRFDGILLSLAQQHPGGVPELLDTIFSFFLRKTDFYTGAKPGQAQELVLNSFRKYEAKALEEVKKRQKEEEDRRKRQQQREEEQRRKEQEQPKVVEITEEQEKQIEEEKKRKEAAKAAAAAAPSDSNNNAQADEEGAEDEGTGLKPNAGNGSSTDKYSWTQTLQEIEVNVPIPKGTTSKQLAIEIKKNRLKVGLKGQPPMIDEELSKAIKPNDSTWVLQDNQLVIISIAKQNQMEWWSRLLVSEPEINTRKIQPENSKLEDLDSETRGVVEKMMFDTRQKQMGLPTSDDLQKQEMLRKFQAAHPEMDFSQAKFS